MHGDNWRLCYKALLVLEYLVKQGPIVSVWRQKLPSRTCPRLHRKMLPEVAHSMSCVN